MLSARLNAMLEPPEGEFLLPIFPLPNVVFFPNTRLPLHVFEPRYRQLVHDALEGDRRFGMALLRPGWEGDYQGSPAVHDHGTVGFIENVVSMEDGRYNLVLVGSVRYRILEQVADSPYRIVRAVAEPEQASDPVKAYAQREWLVDLCSQYLFHLPGGVEVPEIKNVNLEGITNALIMSLDVDGEEKQQLLELNDIVARAERVGTELQKRISNLEFLDKFRTGQDPTLN